MRMAAAFLSLGIWFYQVHAALPTRPLVSHSYSNADEVQVTHTRLDLAVDFNRRELGGTATLTVDRKDRLAGFLILDSMGLQIKEVRLRPSGRLVQHSFGDTDPVFGTPLFIPLEKDTTQTEIRYRTEANAKGVHWRDGSQTLSGRPMVYTTSFAILARSWFPCQDRPSVRMTHEAYIRTPQNALALMSGGNPRNKNGGLYYFQVKEPLPSYLFSLAVGDFHFRALDERTGIYAESALVEQASRDFADTPQMLKTAESLYGSYPWNRYDTIFLDPGFPWGGMENPRLTFSSPFLVTGDGSLGTWPAHEMSHGYFGGAAILAHFNDLWLNEGPTVYAEMHINAELYGKAHADLIALVGLNAFREEVRELGNSHPLTVLAWNIDEMDPDAAIGAVSTPYVKGYLFLRWWEERIGKNRLVEFLRKFLADHSFKVVTTGDFIIDLRNFVGRAEFASLTKEIDEWLYAPGLPSILPTLDDSLFREVVSFAERWQRGQVTTAALPVQNWTAWEKTLFLQALRTPIGPTQLHELEKEFQLFTHPNVEVLREWFPLAIRNKYFAADKEMARFLKSVGRTWNVKPTYEALVNNGRTQQAAQIYQQSQRIYGNTLRSVCVELLGPALLSAKP